MGKPSRHSQSIIELAVFGAILFFLIGGVASVFLNGAYQQNGTLQSMRIAMSKAYESGLNENASRLSGSITIFEDRLAGDFGKFGSVERQPFVVSGSGMLTKNLYLPVQVYEANNLPVMDVQVNGQQFVFTTTAFVNYAFILKKRTSPATINEADPSTVEIWSYVGSDPEWYAKCPPSGGGWTQLVDEENEEYRRRLAYEWSHYFDVCAGTPPFYTSIVANNADWNIGGSTAGALSCNPLTGDPQVSARFDYNRNGNYNDDLPNTRYAAYATWQWIWKDASAVQSEIDPDNDKYPSYDINGDKNEEVLYGLRSQSAPGCGVANYQAIALAPSGGDVDTTRQPEDYVDSNNRQGFRQDMRIYTQMQCTDGAPNCRNGADTTYLDVQEGKRYSLDGKPVNISITQKSEYDVIERVYQLNRNMVDMDGFLSRRNPLSINGIEVACSGGSGSSTPAKGKYVGAGGGCCRDGANVLQTCFDKDDKVLYIRSRISDMRGRKWTTSTDENFTESLGGKP